MEKFSRKKNAGSKGNKAGSGEIREGILECLGSGELCRREEVKDYLKVKYQCSLSDSAVSEALQCLASTKKVWTPQKGYYIREEEEHCSKVFWKLWECRKKLEAVLVQMKLADVKNDIDIVCEIENIEKIIDGLKERTGA